MKDFSKQLENLRKEITEAIIGLLRRHGLTELADWCRENQPFYKKRIPAVNNHFAKMYNLK